MLLVEKCLSSSNCIEVLTIFIYFKIGKNSIFLYVFRNAVAEWLPEFFIKKEAWGPIIKPQPQVTSKIFFFL